MDKDELIKILSTGGRAHKLVEISYFDEKGDQTLRHIEPYEFKFDGVYGYCSLREEIRLFKLDRIRNAVLTNRPFTPRFPIKV